MPLHFHAPIFTPQSFSTSRSVIHGHSLQVSGIVCSSLLCPIKTKNLIGQKDRTQKNEARIFLRSIFLPHNWVRSVRPIDSFTSLVISR
jgi:hypothetical protein